MSTQWGAVMVFCWQFAQDKLHLERREVALDTADVIPIGFRFCGRTVIFQMDNEPDHASKLPEAKQAKVCWLGFPIHSQHPSNLLNNFGKAGGKMTRAEQLERWQ